MAGNARARAGLRRLHGGSWERVQAAHRCGLFAAGSVPGEKGAAIDPAAFQQVLRQKGRLPMAEVLRCRVRYFTDGGVLGSRGFVARQLEDYRRRFGARKRTGPRALLPVTDWGGLTALRGLRRNPFG